MTRSRPVARMVCAGCGGPVRIYARLPHCRTHGCDEGRPVEAASTAHNDGPDEHDKPAS